jgi:hypothetical protein
MKLALLASASLLSSIALAFVPGCTSSETRTRGEPLTFAPEAPARAEGASVSLRSGGVDPIFANRVLVDVVARGAPDVHGAAFRVTWDPEALAFFEAKSGPPWSKQVLALAKEGSPGQLAVAWTEKGESGIDATGETAIGTLVFELRGRKGTALGFKAERSQLVDKKGAAVEAKWLGGSIAAH